MKKITFFNQFHNGDCFFGKSWIRNIMQQLPDIEFSYAHKCHPDIIKDLGCRYIPLKDIPEIDRMVRIAQADDTLYINTWCGAFQGELFGYHQHSNYIIQHRIYEIYCEQLTKILGRPVTQSTNPHEYLPFIDFSYYDTAAVDNFLHSIPYTRHVLICNGPVNSGQSSVGDFRFSIDYLSREFPEISFICTHDVRLKRDNVFYTAQIFNKESDLNEIAYLSTKTELIVGKNSGPYSFCQFDENMNSEQRKFFCFGKLLTDCPNAGLEFPAQFKFCDQTNDRLITNILVRELMPTSVQRTGMQHIMV